MNYPCYQAGAIARELNLSPDDSLYPVASIAANTSPETVLSTISPISKTGWMGKLMGFATRGKLQAALFIIVWLLFTTASVVFIPITFGWWLLKKLVRRT